MKWREPNGSGMPLPTIYAAPPDGGCAESLVLLFLCYVYIHLLGGHLWMLYLHFSSVWGSVCFPARSSWSSILFPACQSNHVCKHCSRLSCYIRFGQRG